MAAPSPKRRGALMPSFNNKDYFSQQDRNSLPEVSPPPDYRQPTEATNRRSDRSVIDQRRMESTGWPAGPAADKHGTANPAGEWQPGEFQRSYPPNDPKNAAWYKDHAWQAHDGRWVTKAGPPTPVAKAGPPKPVHAAAKAVAKAAAKGKR